MTAPADTRTGTEPHNYAPGARIVVRDAEWMVRTCAQVAPGAYRIEAIGVSELVRDTTAVFFTDLDTPQALRPEETRLVSDGTPAYAMSRLYLEAVLRKTPLPAAERGLATAGGFLLDEMTYQLRPAELALAGIRPRVLLADVVGLGKTLEIGLILAELIRRGRGERILVVTPQQVLAQFQQELWTRFAIPLVRLDSVGIERIRREIPAGRNPFLYFKRVIVSVDTLKADQYGHHLENMDWDVVVMDESHNLVGSRTRRNRLAHLLAHRTDALLLASATPHNGDAASFAQLIDLLDPAAIADPKSYTVADIDHLYLRRTKVSPEVRADLGGRWPDRGPTRPVRRAASAAEEKVFAELAGTWLGDAPPPGPNRLWPYTLLKAFLSSPAALSSTVRRRWKAITNDAGDARPGQDPREPEALGRLAELAEAIGPDDTTKLQALVEELRAVRERDAGTRVVVFSESVPTLKWLHEELPARLGLTRQGQVELMHGGLNDTEQNAIIERFGLSTSPVRVLLTSDVFSEGVNLHRHCHRIVHYDIPWSLIRIEQRNGRIDRYGQHDPPEFSALILTSATDGALDDRTVAEKLLHREAEAHRSLGTVEPRVRDRTAEAEEDRLTKDLLTGRTPDEAIERSAPDPGQIVARIMNQVESGTTATAPRRTTAPRLFDSTIAFVREALRLVHPDAARDLELDDDGALLAVNPPPDLVTRLSALPREYLRAREVTKRLRVTTDKGLAGAKLDEARDSKTLWPEIGYLSDLHPMVEWLVDKVLVRLGRGEAPIVSADVAEPVFCVQGVYANGQGRPTVVAWMAVSGLADAGHVDDDLTGVLARAGIGPGMINTGRARDAAGLQALVPRAVELARAHLETRRDSYEADHVAPLAEHADRLATWRQLSLDGVHRLAAGRSRDRERDRIEHTVAEQRELIAKLHTTGEPLLRVLAVLEPNR